MPAENLHVVPDSVTDREACFAEPLAAACRIVEQQVSRTACLDAIPTISRCLHHICTLCCEMSYEKAGGRTHDDSCQR